MSCLVTKQLVYLQMYASHCIGSAHVHNVPCNMVHDAVVRALQRVGVVFRCKAVELLHRCNDAVLVYRRHPLPVEQ